MGTVREPRPFRVAVIGGINTDIWGRAHSALVARDSNPGSVTLRPGGVGRNIAHDLRLLGAEVSLIAPLGGDYYAQSARDSCAALGIDLSLTPVFPEQRSSVYLYVTDDCGDMSVAINDMGICDMLTPEVMAPLMGRLNSFDALVVDTNIPADTIEYICRSAAVPVYADPVSAAKCEKLLPAIKYLTAVKPNRLEAEKLTGEADPGCAARLLVDMGAKRAFVSLGEDGMIAADRDTVLHVPCVRAEVVNTNGAGDAAAAAIVWAGLRGLGLSDTADAAVLAAALTCQSDSANNPEIARITF